MQSCAKPSICSRLNRHQWKLFWRTASWTIYNSIVKDVMNSKLRALNILFIWYLWILIQIKMLAIIPYCQVTWYLENAWLIKEYIICWRSAHALFNLSKYKFLHSFHQRKYKNYVYKRAFAFYLPFVINLYGISNSIIWKQWTIYFINITFWPHKESAYPILRAISKCVSFVVASFISINVPLLFLWCPIHKAKGAPVQCGCHGRHIQQIDGLVQERHNSSALAMELRLSCTKPWQWVLYHSVFSVLAPRRFE